MRRESSLQARPAVNLTRSWRDRENLTMLFYGILNFSEFSGILMESLNFKIGLRLFKWITENNNQHLALKKVLHM